MSDTASSQNFDFSKFSIEQFLLMQRIIVGALAMGLLTFGVVVYLFLGLQGKAEPLMTQLGLGVGLVMLVLNQVVGSIVIGQASKHLPEEEDAARGKLLAANQIGRIVSCAMLEGAGFFNVMVYGFLGGQGISLAMAGLLWLAIMAKFPLRGVLQDWLDRQLRESHDTRTLHGSGR